MQPKTAGVLCLLVTSIMWAIEPIVAKLAYQQADFLSTFTLRTVVIGFVALVYVAFTRHRSFFLTPLQTKAIILIAVLGTLVGDSLYYYALTTAPVINVVVLGHLQPLFIVLFGFFILKEDKLTTHDYVGIAAMLVAALFITTKTIANFSMLKLGSSADLLVLSATFVWAVMAIVMRKYLTTIHAGVGSFYRFFIAGFILLMILLFKKAFVFSWYAFLTGLVAGVGFLLYYEGMKRLKAAQVSALELAAPFFAALLGYLILGETMTLLQGTGIAILVVGVLLLAKDEHCKEEGCIVTH